MGGLLGLAYAGLLVASILGFATTILASVGFAGVLTLILCFAWATRYARDVETFVPREDAERFVEEVRGDDHELAS
jgi:uncharacterized membrane protein YuzA (DUF378 family)